MCIDFIHFFATIIDCPIVIKSWLVSNHVIVDTPAVIDCVKTSCLGQWIGLKTSGNSSDETECVPTASR